MFSSLRRWVMVVWAGPIATYCLAGVAIFVILAHIFAPRYEGPLPQAISQENNAYVSVLSRYIYWRHPIWSFSASGDSNGSNNQSDLVVMENGVPLGPAHCLHDSIRTNGKGRYSHWEGILYFSTSDNSDPATNGRKYTISGTLGVRWWMDLLLLVCVCVILTRNFFARNSEENRKVRDNPHVGGKLLPYTWGGTGVAKIFPQVAPKIRPWHKLSKFAWRYCAKARKASPLCAIVDFFLLIVPMIFIAGFASLFLLSMLWAWYNKIAFPVTGIFHVIPTLNTWLTHNALKQGILSWFLIALSWLWVSPFASTGFAQKLLIRILQSMGLGLVLCWCWLVLAMAQHGEGVAMASIGGVIPFTDANGYWRELQNFFFTGEWLPFSSRRPLAAALRQCTAIAGSHSNILFLQTTLFAVSLWLAVKSIGQWRGAWAAMFFCLLAISGTDGYLPSTLTEAPSMWLALLVIPCLIAGLRCRSLLWCLCALALYCFAQLARMGAVLIIPLFFFWILWQARKESKNIWRVIGGAVLVGILCIGTVKILQNLYADTSQILGGNFSWTLAGLSLGGEWSLPLMHYKKELAGLTAQEKEHFLFNMALQNIATTPGIFIKALTDSGIEFIKNIRVLIDGYHVPKVHPILFYMGISFYGLGIMTMRRRREKGELLFYICICVGLLCSSLITMHSEGWRVMLAGYPLVWLFIATFFVAPFPSKPLGGMLHRMQFPVCSLHLAHNAMKALKFAGLILLAALTIPSLQAKSRCYVPVEAQASYPDMDIIPAQFFSGILVIPDDESVDVTIPCMKQNDFFEYIKKYYSHWELNPALWPTPPFSVGTWSWFFAVGPPEILRQPSKNIHSWALFYENWPVEFKTYVGRTRKILFAIPLDKNGNALTPPNPTSE